MTTRKVESFYYPVFKGSKIPTNEELQQKIVIYFTHHPDLKPQRSKPWYRSKVSLVSIMKLWIVTLLCHPNHWKNLAVPVAQFVIQVLNCTIF